LAKCKTCDGELSFFGKCEACRVRENKEALEAEEIRAQDIAAQKQQKEASRKLKQEKEVAEKKQKAASLKSIVLTTEVSTNLNIVERKKVIIASADCSFDVNISKFQDELMLSLRESAYNEGANAVVGINFNIIETYNTSIGVGEFKKFKMIAYGTAVVVE
jgi:uncharacterized protein YbjQ (UPF0145 family)